MTFISVHLDASETIHSALVVDVSLLADAGFSMFKYYQAVCFFSHELQRVLPHVKGCKWVVVAGQEFIYCFGTRTFQLETGLLYSSNIRDALR
jgi:hypothetical protein